MRRLTNWLLFVLALASAGLGAAQQLAWIHTPVSALAFAAIAVAIAGLQAIRLLPLGVRRPVVFVVALAIIVALTGGLAYFQFVIKPNIVKTALSAAFAPKPTAVAVEQAKVEQWPPQLSAIGSLRAFQGIVVAPQVAGVVSAIHFESGDDVAAGAPLVGLDTSVEEADLANGRAQLKNANVILDRARALIASGNTPQSTVDAALAARDSAAATVERTQAVIAQKTIRAPFAGRLGLRNVDLGQYVGAGASLTTLQQLDPIYVDFSAPEGALANLAVGQETTLAVDARPGSEFKGKVTAIDARVSSDSRNVTVRAQFANSDHRAAARHVRRRDRHHRRAGGRADPAAHRDRLQPLWRQRVRRRPGEVGRRADGGAPLRAGRRDAGRADRHCRGREDGRKGGDRRPDQVAAEHAGRNRPGRRPAAAGRNAEALTDR